MTQRRRSPARSATLQSLPPRVQGRVAITAAGVLTALLLGGCGAAASRIDTGGIDGLVVPAPSLAPADFDTRAVNRWFPLEPGTTYFRVEGDTLATRVEVEMLPERRTVAGVEAVEVRRVVFSEDEQLTATTSWYATDDDGNVWLVGERTTVRVDGRDSLAQEWTAGQGGAEAGLVMPAEPRRGDGFAAARVADGFPVRMQVLAVAGHVPGTTSERQDVVVLRVERTALDGVEETRYHVPGEGLVLTVQETTTGTVRIERVPGN